MIGFCVWKCRFYCVDSLLFSVSLCRAGGTLGSRSTSSGSSASVLYLTNAMFAASKRPLELFSSSVAHGLASAAMGQASEIGALSAAEKKMKASLVGKLFITAYEHYDAAGKALRAAATYGEMRGSDQ